MLRGVRLEIDAVVLQSIALTIRTSNPHLETGGALFGPPDGSRVLHAAGPGPMAEHRARYFRRDIVFTQDEADRLYQADGSQWIGEWHTHIGMPPAPSEVDLRTYRKHIADRDLGFDRFVALIITPSGACPMLAVWILERRSGNIILTNADTQPFDLGM